MVNEKEGFSVLFHEWSLKEVKCSYISTFWQEQKANAIIRIEKKYFMR